MATFEPKRKLRAVKSDRDPFGTAVGLDRYLAGLSADMLLCRDLGHAWKPYTAKWLPVDKCYESKLICSRCETFRFRWLSKTGQLLGTAYTYSDGYLVVGMGRLATSDRDRIRSVSLQRMLTEADAADDM
jgi:hypothetical protein